MSRDANVTMAKLGAAATAACLVLLGGGEGGEGTYPSSILWLPVAA